MFCGTHYADPAHVSLRCWNLCSNAALGCQFLSTDTSRGSCYACRAHEYPCKYALVGCPHHVLCKDSLAEKRQHCCLSDESFNACVYDPAKKRRCSAPLCPELAVADDGPFCTLCETEHTPCPELCGRPSTIGNDGHCALYHHRPLPITRFLASRLLQLAALLHLCPSVLRKIGFCNVLRSLCLQCVSGLKLCRATSVHSALQTAMMDFLVSANHLLLLPFVRLPCVPESFLVQRIYHAHCALPNAFLAHRLHVTVAFVWPQWVVQKMCRAQICALPTCHLFALAPCINAYFGCHEKTRVLNSAAFIICKHCKARDRPCASCHYCQRRAQTEVCPKNAATAPNIAAYA